MLTSLLEAPRDLQKLKVNLVRLSLRWPIALLERRAQTYIIAFQ